VLAVYTRLRDPDYRPVRLDAETRVPLPMKPGRPGTANLFMMFAPLEGRRHVEVTNRRTAVDYVHVLKDLADLHFANAKTIVLIQDNPNIHIKASLYEPFPAAKARRLVERFEWHYTLKYGSWLDLAEVRTRHSILPVAVHYLQRTHQTQASLPLNLNESSDLLVKRSIDVAQMSRGTNIATRCCISSPESSKSRWKIWGFGAR
jgi:hypothetical protein